MKNKNKIIGSQYRQNSELSLVKTHPPNDHCGYYGIVMKPKWFPSKLAYLLRNHLSVYLGWLNMPCSNKPYNNPKNKRYWWAYPSNENHTGSPNIEVKPFLWCEIEYTGRIVDEKGNVLRKNLK